MARNKTIANRLREVYLNGRWVANTNYKELIEDLNWKQSTTQIENLNTIALLTFHINYYLEGILQVFNGGKLEIRDKYSFDMPAITSETDWKNLVNEFLSNSKKFVSHIENMDDSQLDTPFVDEKYGTYLRNIEGVIEHSYYHLGQISLIKKMILKKEEV